MTEPIKFTPKPLSNEDFMKRYRRECAETGTPVDPAKCQSGDPGTVTTSDGDIFYIGNCPDCGEPMDGLHKGSCSWWDTKQSPS